jgi:hypothetical protein
VGLEKMTENPRGVIVDDCLGEIISGLRANLGVLDRLGLQVAAAHLNLAIEDIEARRTLPVTGIPL